MLIRLIFIYKHYLAWLPFVVFIYWLIVLHVKLIRRPIHKVVALLLYNTYNIKSLIMAEEVNVWKATSLLQRYRIIYPCQRPCFNVNHPKYSLIYSVFGRSELDIHEYWIRAVVDTDQKANARWASDRRAGESQRVFKTSFFIITRVRLTINTKPKSC